MATDRGAATAVLIRRRLLRTRLGDPALRHFLVQRRARDAEQSRGLRAVVAGHAQHGGDLGYTVLEACDGAQALGIIRTSDAPIHLLLCDIALPGHDGRKVSEEMCASRPGVPTLFMSGYAADVMADRLSLDPGVRFLEKPFTRQLLAQLVRSTIDDAKPITSR